MDFRRIAKPGERRRRETVRRRRRRGSFTASVSRLSKDRVSQSRALYQSDGE